MSGRISRRVETVGIQPYLLSRLESAFLSVESQEGLKQITTSTSLAKSLGVL